MQPKGRYNSAVLVSPQGNVLANYRKSFLFTTDETWAEEGPGFFAGDFKGSLGSVAMGICMSSPYVLPHTHLLTWPRHGSES